MARIVCPWCGTNYTAFQTNCEKCGGPLTAQTEAEQEDLPVPPSAPRPISDNYVLRLLSVDGWSIAALVFCILGMVFSLLGFGLILGVVTFIIGLVFLPLGLVFLGAAFLLFVWRYRRFQKVVQVLRDGTWVDGQISAVAVNYSVRINGRSPWTIQYTYQVNGQMYEGSVSTLNEPGEQLKTGKAARILYLAAEPKWSSIYPHP